MKGACYFCGRMVCGVPWAEINLLDGSDEWVTEWAHRECLERARDSFNVPPVPAMPEGDLLKPHFLSEDL